MIEIVLSNTSRKSIVFQNNLVNDSRTRFPKSKSIFSTSRSQKVVNLLVGFLSTSKILDSVNLSFNQVITMDGGWNSDSWKTCRHELQKRHLGSSVLASNSVGTKVQVRASSLNVLILGIIQVAIDNLFSKGQWVLQSNKIR